MWALHRRSDAKAGPRASATLHGIRVFSNAINQSEPAFSKVGRHDGLNRLQILARVGASVGGRRGWRRTVPRDGRAGGVAALNCAGGAPSRSVRRLQCQDRVLRADGGLHLRAVRAVLVECMIWLASRSWAQVRPL